LIPIKRIDWLVLRSFLGPLLMSLIIILFILVMQFMSLYIQEIMGKGLGPAILGKLFYYAGGRLILSALPVAILAAALMTFGNMGEHNELAAIKSCGISLFKIMRSTLILSILLTSFSLWFSFEIIPRANLKFFSLYYDVQRKKADVAIKPGHFYSDIDGYVIRVSDKNTESGTLFDVLIYNHTENRGNTDIILADSARMGLRGNQMYMLLYAGVRYEAYNLKEKDGKQNLPFGRTYFDSLIYAFTLEGFELDRTDEKQFRHQITLPMHRLADALDSLDILEAQYIEKSILQLSRYTKVDTSFTYYLTDSTRQGLPLAVVELGAQDSLLGCYETEDEVDLISRALVNARAVRSYVEFMVKKREDQEESQRRYAYEYYFRYALPFNCIVFFLIGASLGAIIRKGGLGPPALVSIVFFLVFYVLTTYGKKFAKEGVMDPWVGAWLSVLVCAPIALYFTYQATMDASLFNESTWLMFRDWWHERRLRLGRWLGRGANPAEEDPGARS